MQLASSEISLLLSASHFVLFSLVPSSVVYCHKPPNTFLSWMLVIMSACYYLLLNLLGEAKLLVLSPQLLLIFPVHLLFSPTQDSQSWSSLISFPALPVVSFVLNHFHLQTGVLFLTFKILCSASATTFFYAVFWHLFSREWGGEVFLEPVFGLKICAVMPSLLSLKVEPLILCILASFTLYTLCLQFLYCLQLTFLLSLPQTALVTVRWSPPC